MQSRLVYFNGSNLHCLGKGKEYGLVQPHILSMGTYARKTIKIMLKRTFCSKPLLDTSQRIYAHIREYTSLLALHYVREVHIQRKTNISII